VIHAVSNLGSSELAELETFSAEFGLPVIMSPTSLVQEIYQIGQINGAKSERQLK
jgi:hypothetical protein